MTDASDQEGEAALPPSDESQADDGTPAEETEPVLTYRQVMTDGRFGIGSFLPHRCLPTTGALPWT